MNRTLALCVTIAVGGGCKGKQPETSTPGSAQASGAVTEAGSADSAGSAGSAAVPVPAGSAATMPPAERAKLVLDAQVAALKAGADDKLAATFDSSAVILARVGYALTEADLAKQVASINPHDTIKDIRVTKTAAGGNADAVWFVAEIAITKDVAEPESKPETRTETVRASELVTASSQWKVVAAAFSQPRELRKSRPIAAMPGASTPGALSGLLADPAKAAASLSTDPAVAAIGVGENDFATGSDAAKKILETVKAKPITADSVREVRDAKWGFVQATLESPPDKGSNPYRFTGQLIAVPNPDGTWQVVAVHYLGL